MTEAKAIRLSQFQQFDSTRVVSKLIHDSERCRVVLFCLEAGQEVTPHTSRSEVLFYGVEGQGTISIGADEIIIEEGTLVACPQMVPHGIKAEERNVVLAIITPRPE